MRAESERSDGRAGVALAAFDGVRAKAGSCVVRELKTERAASARLVESSQNMLTQTSRPRVCGLKNGCGERRPCIIHGAGQDRLSRKGGGGTRPIQRAETEGT